MGSQRRGEDKQSGAPVVTWAALPTPQQKQLIDQGGTLHRAQSPVSGELQAALPAAGPNNELRCQ